MHEEEEIKIVLKKIVDDLCSPINSSMRICFPYWKARCLLRLVALNAYKELTSKYIEEGISLEFPSKGFKCVSDDYNDMMKYMDNDYMLHPAEELSDE